MSKGFGQPKRPTDRERKRLIYLIRERKDYWAASQYMDKLAAKYGREAASDLFSGDSDLFMDYRSIMPAEIRQNLDEAVQPKAEALMAQMFTGWGLEPGKDFSIASDDRGQRFWVFSDAACDKAEAEGFPVREMLKDLPQPAFEAKDPIAALDAHCGVPFTKNLIAALAAEFATCSTMDIALCKIGRLCNGLENANPHVEWLSFLVNGIRTHLGDVWVQSLGEAYKQLQKCSEEEISALEGSIEEGWEFGILLRSLEREPKLGTLPTGEEQLVISADDCRELHKVWRGEKFTCLELAAILDEHSKRNK